MPFKKPVLVFLVVFCITCILIFGLRLRSINFQWFSPTDSINKGQFHENIISYEITTCVARENVVYFKTHKTGSSSIQNVFMRYGIGHDLLIVVPVYYNYFGHPTPFHLHMAPQLKAGYHYSIFTHHTRFSYGALHDLMPLDAKFITTLREPTALFESAYNFYYLPWLYNMSLEQFVNHDYVESNIAKLNRRVIMGRIGRNQMSFDLGVEIDQFENETEILKVAESLDQQFDLVMITERMLESLVLLKHLLCWTTDDVVAFKANARDEKTKLKLTPALRTKILKWNKADKLLYDYFSKRFEKKVLEFGKEKMEMELQELKNSIQNWYNYCIAGKGGTSGFADNVLNFKVKNTYNETCRYLASPEMNFTEEILAKQRKYYL